MFSILLLDCADQVTAELDRAITVPHLEDVVGQGIIIRPRIQLTEAQQCAAALSRMVELHQPTDGTDTLIAEINRAVAKLKVVSWEAIHSDRFHLTPYELYLEIVRNAEARLSRHDAEAERRCTRLEVDDEEVEEDADPGNNYVRLLDKDKFGLDIDKEFKFPAGRGKNIKKPSGWRRAVRLASEVHINEMRLLMNKRYAYT